MKAIILFAKALLVPFAYIFLLFGAMIQVIFYAGPKKAYEWVFAKELRKKRLKKFQSRL